MTTVNGMEVKEDLVDFLKQLAPMRNGIESSLDSHIDSLLEVNDYLLQSLTAIATDDIISMKKLSNHMINVKCIKDDLKKLNSLLKTCSINRELEK